MPGPEFFQTTMGHQFYDGTMPRIAKALERIATALEAQQAMMPLAVPRPESNEPVGEARDIEEILARLSRLEKYGTAKV